MKKSRIIALALLALLMGVAACNTMEGFGTDMKNAGNDISSAAQKAKQ